MIEPGIFISEFLKQIASPAHTKKNYGKRKLSNLHSQFCVHLIIQSNGQAGGTQRRLLRKFLNPFTDDGGHLLAGLQDESMFESVRADNSSGFRHLELQVVVVLQWAPMVFGSEIQHKPVAVKTNILSIQFTHHLELVVSHKQRTFQRLWV